MLLLLARNYDYQLAHHQWPTTTVQVGAMIACSCVAVFKHSAWSVALLAVLQSQFITGLDARSSFIHIDGTLRRHENLLLQVDCVH